MRTTFNISCWNRRDPRSLSIRPFSVGRETPRRWRRSILPPYLLQHPARFVHIGQLAQHGWRSSLPAGPVLAESPGRRGLSRSEAECADSLTGCTQSISVCRMIKQGCQNHRVMDDKALFVGFEATRMQRIAMAVPCPSCFDSLAADVC